MATKMDINSELVARAKRGDDAAVAELIEFNQGLIRHIINKHSTSLARSHIEDMMAEGVLGLLEAVRKYNPHKGAFSTYAHFWVKEKVLGYIERQKGFTGETFWKILAVERYANRLKTNAYNLSTADVKKACKRGMGKARVQAIKYFAELRQWPRDWYNTKGAQDHRDTANSPLENATEAEQRVELRKSLDKLDVRSRSLVCGYYGIDCEPRTLFEIANSLNLTRQRTSQIHAEAIEKLRTIVPQ